MYLSATLVAAAALYAATQLRAWRKHLLQARAMGLPCILVPGLPMSPAMRILHLVLSSLFGLFPQSWAPAWLTHLDLMSGWHEGYGTFEKLGADSYVLVAPTGLMVVTCAPDAVDDVLHRRETFPRPAELFGAIARYGRNLASSEGVAWKRMRREVTRAFGDRNSREVWAEALYQAPRMVRSWTLGKSIPLDGDTRRFSQNVISKAGFGFRMAWNDGVGAERSAYEEVETKHSGLGYVDAARGLVRNILIVIGLPEFLLKTFARRVYLYDVSFRAHMLETIRQSRAQPGNDASDVGREDLGSKRKLRSGDDILHALLRNRNEKTISNADGNTYSSLSDADILANSFLLILGGHETVATSIQTAIIFLALNPPAQRDLQAELDRIFGDRPPESWTYDTDLPRLLEGLIGATIHEQLRLVSPVTSILTTATVDTTATFSGTPISIPAGTYVSLSQLGAHRNPHFWPHGPPTDQDDASWHPKSNRDNDLEEFRPERWFVDDDDGNNSEKRTFFRPQRGAYFPFSDGSRTCVGRRFAQIEIAAALAVLFRQYSVEIDVGLSDTELDSMAMEQRREVWREAAKRTRGKIRQNMRLVMTMHLKGGQEAEIPVRLVERGRERFCF